MALFIATHLALTPVPGIPAHLPGTHTPIDADGHDANAGPGGERRAAPVAP